MQSFSFRFLMSGLFRHVCNPVSDVRFAQTFSVWFFKKRFRCSIGWLNLHTWKITMNAPSISKFPPVLRIAIVLNDRKRLMKTSGPSIRSIHTAMETWKPVSSSKTCKTARVKHLSDSEDFLAQVTLMFLFAVSIFPTYEGTNVGSLSCCLTPGFCFASMRPKR